ncbi:MAG: NAD(P)/FAD-dependent oxidoreductase [Haloarculaceae archaeon]
MDVAVVGGGIVGLASAYYLADRGATVTVYEKGSLGNGSTERSAGGIRTQFSTPINVALSVASIDVWEDFEAAFGTDVAYRRSGYLFLAREADTVDRFRADVAMQRDHGVPSEFLSPEEAVEHCPELRTEAFVGATYSPIDGFADPHLALQGFAAAARDAGAEIRTETPVTDLSTSADGSVTGVGTDDDRRAVDFVVNAAGPWARRVASMADVDLPVVPRRRQVAVVEPERPVPESVPLTIDLDTGSYFRPERGGDALVGGHFDDADPDSDPDAFDERMDLDWAATAVERAADVAAYFGPDARVKRGWAGLYAVTPDHHPIVEETRPGLVNAVGFSGHGFQHSPATGRIVAQLCLDGAASLVDVSPLSSDRFEDGDGIEEHNVA